MKVGRILSALREVCLVGLANRSRGSPSESLMATRREFSVGVLYIALFRGEENSALNSDFNYSANLQRRARAELTTDPLDILHRGSNFCRRRRYVARLKTQTDESEL